ncbi:hypothetical protein BH721_03270 [Clostridium baratii]|uniref:hypothetical protein n=1 Tax=Clostridium baratii TaxID=1561 RepID=UPI0009A465DD|nr:hypothetical protein [Clostridium baratii]OPF51182.1 hypothetical protein A1M12_01205 [Clostridium baratii]OPF55741.1 hypothetical protein BH721_03270 [Clostridium baratii]OPF56879.1 hypothetical protein BH724_10155 [Clostridium baratii]OPF59878.1 hypothetical protein BH725_04655 [Clostridium baratii]
MKKYRMALMKRLLILIVTSPIFLIVYGISFYELYTLCKFGIRNHNIAILFLCMLFFLGCLIFLLYKNMRELEYLPYGIINIYEFSNDGIKIVQEENLEVKFHDMKSFDINNKYVFISLKNKDILILNIMNKTSEEKESIKNILKDNIKYIQFYNIKWTCVSILIIISITSFYGVKIYNSAINYNERLAWFLEDLRMRKSLNNIEVKNPQEDKEETYKEDTNEKDEYEGENTPQIENKEAQEFHLSSEDIYALGVVGAALGSRFYALYETNDGGKTWDIINNDPFNGRMGGATGITFIDNKLGFIALSHSGGSYGELYRTDDGGASYKEVSFQEVKVKLNEKETYNPFVLPGMPYREGNELKVLVGQGSNGDYNGVCKALYESKDEGKTWKYVKEVPLNQ